MLLPALLVLLLVPRMVHDNFVAQELSVEMGVNLCSCDAFVSEHILYGAQIGTIFKQMRCK